MVGHPVYVSGRWCKGGGMKRHVEGTCGIAVAARESVAVAGVGSTVWMWGYHLWLA